MVAGRTHSAAQHHEIIKEKIRKDLQNRSFQYRVVKSNEFICGYIFYPGEVKSAKVLRLQVDVTDTNKISTFNMKLK